MKPTLSNIVLAINIVILLAYALLDAAVLIDSPAHGSPPAGCTTLFLGIVHIGLLVIVSSVLNALKRHEAARAVDSSLPKTAIAILVAIVLLVASWIIDG